MSRKSESKAAVSAAHDSSLIDDVLKAIAPLVATATVKAVEARQKAAPLAEQAKEKADQAKERLAPLANQAKEQGQHLGEQARERIVPLVDQTNKNVAPHVDTARAKVQDDLVPKLVDLLHQAEEHPAVAQASSRGKATMAALKGEIAVPEKKQRNVGATLAKLAAASALLAAAAVAVRQFLGSKDDAWTAHQPSEAYVNKPNDLDSDLDRAETATSGTEGEPDPEAVMADEGGIPNDGETVSETINALNEYGEGSYVGDEPPADYVVKGNERSMKYHTPESGGYERTIADVWFNSTEAAEKAGFTLAQR